MEYLLEHEYRELIDNGVTVCQIAKMYNIKIEEMRNYIKSVNRGFIRGK